MPDDPAARLRAAYEAPAQGWNLRRTRALFERGWLDRFLTLVPHGAAVLDLGCGAVAAWISLRNDDNALVLCLALVQIVSRPKGNSPMHWNERIDNYTRQTGYPRSLFVAEDGRIVGTWIMGNDYRVKSSYYGGYPAGYLKRVRALFPEKKRTLHLFSGQVDVETFPGDTVDINPALNPTYVDDAQALTNVPLEQYDLVLADPPYSVEDCEHYGTSMVKRNKVMRALQSLPSGAHVVWLDQVLPMYRKDTFDLEATIGMWKSTNHRFRGISIFKRRTMH